MTMTEMSAGFRIRSDISGVPGISGVVSGLDVLAMVAGTFPHPRDKSPFPYISCGLIINRGQVGQVSEPTLWHGDL